MSLSSRSAIPSSIVALGAAAIACAPASASAQLGDPIAISPGLSLNIQFGQKLAFGLSFDFRVTGIVHNAGGCTREASRAGLGPYAQVTWLNFSHWRVGAGVHGGGEAIKQSFAVDGEVGWTYHTRYDGSHPGEHGLQFGVLGLGTPTVFAPSLELGLRSVLPVGSPFFEPEFIVGAGGRWPMVFGMPQNCVEGRPLRAGDQVVLPPVATFGERRMRAAGLDRGTRAALAAAWLTDARSECASVPAFLALARDLAACKAPPDLVARALASAEDELRHTQICAEIGGGLAGIDARPLLLSPPPPDGADRRDLILRLARESWLDGCLGEGAAAARARRALAGATEVESRAGLLRIARDEARHAELGWSVLAHCLSAGGSEVRDAIADLVTAPDGEPPRGDAKSDADPRALRAHGRLAQRDADEAWRDTLGEARRRASPLLVAA